MRKGFLDPPSSTTSPAEVAFDRGVRSLQARQFSRAHKLFSLAISLDRRFDLARQLKVEVRSTALALIQALFRGALVRLHLLPFHRAPQVPFQISPGHPRVRSPLNLQRYLGWLREEKDSGVLERVAAAFAVYERLPITWHAWHLDGPIHIDSCFGRLPAIPCRRRPCRQCVGEGGFDIFSPLAVPALGGFHFRFLGPWSTANNNSPPVEV